MRSETDLYWKALRYRGRGNVVVDLAFEQLPDLGQFAWRFSFRRGLTVGVFPTKLDALIAAAHACGKSGAEMNWTPEVAT